mmetsp:Transcript_2767/g.8135  ORF Transcript_2767/g.8135 Transcript_2767/m.8135 type:complete len:409 (+) Transcript_2767:120-1346(+)
MADSDDEYERDERAADNARGRKRKSKKRSHESPEEHGGDAAVPTAEEGNGGGRGGGGKKKKKKVKVMEESGQTDEERRALRRKQRQLQHKIVASETGAQLEDPNADAFEEIRGENNKLFESVRYTREAVMDGDNLQLMSERTARQVDKLVQVPRYDSTRFVQKLRGKLSAKSGSNTYFNWRTLGREAGVCFNSVPSRVAFLNGPVDVVYVPKERKKREKRVVEEESDDEEEQPEELDQKKQKADADKLSAVERNMAIVNKVLNQKSSEAYAKAHEAFKEEEDTLDPEERKRKKKRVKAKGREVDAVQHLFNPKSFTQTVENIFHFSFLVKKGSAGIAVRSEKEAKEFGGVPGPVVRAYAPTKEGETPVPKQAIVSLNMRDWRDMCKAFEVTESDIPHRKGSKHARKKK